VEGAPGGTLTVAGEQEHTSFNWVNSEHNAAWTSYFMQLVWPSATIFSPEGEPVENSEFVSYELTSEDPQVVTYTVNEDAVWSDGEPISLEDFQFTWRSQNGKEKSTEVDPDTGEPLPLFNAADTTGYQDITSVEAGDDDNTIVVTYENKFADWKALFSPILPLHAFKAAGGGDEVVGFATGFNIDTVDLANVVSGAWYSVTDQQIGTSLTLDRNDSYWGKPGNLDEIVIRWITDATQEPAALANNEADVAFPQAQIDLVQQTEGIPGIETFVGFGTFWEHIDFNFANPHLAKVEVRTAIAHAIDRSEVVERLPAQFDPSAEVLNNRMFFPASSAYEPHGEDEYGAQDIDGAKALLESAGYTLGADGIYAHPTDGKLSLRFTWRDPNPRREQTFQLVQSQLKEAGIEVNDARAPDFTFLDTGDFDIALFGWTGGTTLAGQVAIYSTDGGNNNGKYSNSEVDQLLDQSDEELDEDTRTDLLNQVDTILWKDMPTIPMFQVPEFLAWRDTVSNVSYNGYQGFTWNAEKWSVA